MSGLCSPTASSGTCSAGRGGGYRQGPGWASWVECVTARLRAPGSAQTLRLNYCLCFHALCQAGRLTSPGGVSPARALWGRCGVNPSHPADGLRLLSPQLMKCVRLPLLSRDFLMSNVDTELLVRHHSECKDLLIEALKYHLMPEQRGVLSNSRTRPRRCEGASTVLFAVGKALPRARLRANPFAGACHRCLLSSPSHAQVGGACSPSTGTVKPMTRGQTGGTWWPPCRLAGPEWALLPSGTSCMLWAGKEGREPGQGAGRDALGSRWAQLVVRGAQSCSASRGGRCL